MQISLALRLKTFSSGPHDIWIALVKRVLPVPQGLKENQYINT